MPCQNNAYLTSLRLLCVSEVPESEVCVQDSEAAGEQSFAEFKRQRRAEQDDVEFPDEVL